MINLLYLITQIGYQVQFNPDMEGMVRIDFYLDGDPITIDNPNGFYYHEHIGYPEQSEKELEAKIIDCLERFYEEHK